jgi:hypothetical protein
MLAGRFERVLELSLLSFESVIPGFRARAFEDASRLDYALEIGGVPYGATPCTAWRPG